MRAIRSLILSGRTRAWLFVLAPTLLWIGGCQSGTPDPAQTETMARIIRCEAGRWAGEGNFLPRVFLDPDQPLDLRIRSALAMGRIGAPSMMAVLRRGLSDPEAAVRAMSLFALGEILDKDNLALYRIQPDPAIIRDVRRLLADPAAAVRARAVEALGKTGNRELVPELPALAPSPGTLGEESVRLYAREWVKAAFRLKHPGCVAPLRNLLSGPLREIALVALTRLAAPGQPAVAVPAAEVERLLGDPDPGVRAAAARLAGVIARPLPASVLAGKLTDPSPAVRTNLLAGLGRLGGAEPARILIRYLEQMLAMGVSPADRNRAHWYKEMETAVAALGRAGDRSAIPPLRRWMSLNAELAPYCAQALVALQPSIPLAELAATPALASQARATRWVQAVAGGSDPSCPAFLQELERGMIPAGWQKSWVAAARPFYLPAMLKSLGPAGAETAGRLLVDPDPFVRAAVMDTIGEKPLADQEALLPKIAESVRLYPRPASMDPLVSAIPFLPRLGEPGKALLTGLLKAPFYRVRLLAAGALHDLGEAGRFTGIVPLPTRDPGYYRNMVRRWEFPCSIEILTNKGRFTLRLLREDAPLTCQNFLELAGERYYDGISFHRVVPDFVVQGGCPLGSGNGGPDYAIPCEINPVPYLRGTVGMALSGKDTGGSQFFVALSPQPHLEGGYTVFAEVTGGMEVVENILEGDRILSMDVYWDLPARDREAAGF